MGGNNVIITPRIFLLSGADPDRYARIVERQAIGKMADYRSRVHSGIFRIPPGRMGPTC